MVDKRGGGGGFPELYEPYILLQIKLFIRFHKIVLPGN